MFCANEHYDKFVWRNKSINFLVYDTEWKEKFNQQIALQQTNEQNEDVK